MNTNNKAQIIMDELLEIVGVSTGNHPSTTAIRSDAIQTNPVQSKSKDPLPLTVQDIINQLSEMVRKNPESAEYQIAEYSYDDFAVGPAYAVFSVKSIDVIKLPEDNEDQFVDDKLTSDKIAIFST